MTTDSYQNTKSADTGDSTSKNDEVAIDNGNANKRSFLIIAGSLLALLVLVVAGENVGQDLSPAANEITKGASALADYQVDTANSALTNNIFGMGAVSGNEEGCDFAAGKCPVIPGSDCVTPNGGGLFCKTNGACSKICCGSVYSNCCMCQEYCDAHCDCSDYFQVRCLGCCCKDLSCGWAQPNPTCQFPCDGVNNNGCARTDEFPCGDYDIKKSCHSF